MNVLIWFAIISYSVCALYVGFGVLFGLSMKYQHPNGGKSPTLYIVSLTLACALFWPIALPVLAYTNLANKL